MRGARCIRESGRFGPQGNGGPGDCFIDYRLMAGPGEGGHEFSLFLERGETLEQFSAGLWDEGGDTSVEGCLFLFGYFA